MIHVIGVSPNQPKTDCYDRIPAAVLWEIRLLVARLAKG